MEGGSGRALPTETKVESGTSQSKSGTSVTLSHSGELAVVSSSWCQAYTLHLTPYTLHPTSCTLHPTPYTLHPTPYTLHPTTYTLHPTPHTLHPSNSGQRVASQRAHAVVLLRGGQHAQREALSLFRSVYTEFNLRPTTSQKCAAVPRWARI